MDKKIINKQDWCMFTHDSGLSKDYIDVRKETLLQISQEKSLKGNLLRIKEIRCYKCVDFVETCLICKARTLICSCKKYNQNTQSISNRQNKNKRQTKQK